MSVYIDPSHWYDDDDLYSLLRLAPRTLARARCDGCLRFTRVGNRTLYLGEWVSAWLVASSQFGGKNVSIAELGLSIRTRNCLECEGVNTLRDLMARSDEELLCFRNFGETSLREVKAKVQMWQDAQKGKVGNG